MKSDLVWVIIFWLGGLIVIPIGSYVIDVHREINSYPLCTAVFDNQAVYHLITASSSYYSVHVVTTGHCDNKTLPIKIKYPPPPYKINLKSLQEVNSWMAATSNKERIVFLNPKISKSGHHIGFTENIGIVGWSFGIAFYGLFYGIIVIIIIYQLCIKKIVNII